MNRQVRNRRLRLVVREIVLGLSGGTGRREEGSFFGECGIEVVWSFGLWRSFGALASPAATLLDVDDMSPMHEAVNDGGGKGRVAQHLAPLFHREVAGDDGGLSLVPGFDEVEEETGILRLGREVSKVIEDEQVEACQASDEAVGGVVGQGGVEVGQHA